MSEIAKACAEVVDALILNGVRRATKYLSPDCTVKATRRVFRAYGKRPRKRERLTEVVLSFGSPNYEERGFIKTLKAAEEPFPVKKVQLKHFSETRHSHRRAG